MPQDIDARWLTDTLTDAAQTLAEAIALIEEDPRHAQGVLENEIPALYAKLNYAVNTAHSGPNSVNELDHDTLVAWPKGLPFGKCGHTAQSSREKA